MPHPPSVSALDATIAQYDADDVERARRVLDEITRRLDTYLNDGGDLGSLIELAGTLGHAEFAIRSLLRLVDDEVAIARLRALFDGGGVVIGVDSAPDPVDLVLDAVGEAASVLATYYHPALDADPIHRGDVRIATASLAELILVLMRGDDRRRVVELADLIADSVEAARDDLAD